MAIIWTIAIGTTTTTIGVNILFAHSGGHVSPLKTITMGRKKEQPVFTDADRKKRLAKMVAELRAEMLEYNRGFKHAQIDVDAIPKTKMENYAMELDGGEQRLMAILGHAHRTFPRIDKRGSDSVSYNDTLSTDNNVLLCKFHATDAPILKRAFGLYNEEIKTMFADMGVEPADWQKQPHGRMLRRAGELAHRFHTVRDVAAFAGVKWDSI